MRYFVFLHDITRVFLNTSRCLL